MLNPSTDQKKKEQQYIEKVEEVELSEKIRFIIELYKNEEKLKSYNSFNSQVIDLQLDGVPYIPPDAKPKKGEGMSYSQ